MSEHMTVDGLPVPVRPGETMLTACRRAGISIPTLCYHPGLEPYGACRLCVVEATRPDTHAGPPAPGRVVASCTTPAQAGTVVRTDSPRVMRVRRAVLTFLLERCPDAGIVQQLAEGLGIAPAPGSRARIPAPTESALPPVPAPLKEKCILCGRCVQACERLGHFAIGFAGRGVFRRVTPPFGTSSETCAACGACMEVCPTGAVDVVIERSALPPHAGVPVARAHLPAWQTTVPLGTCRSCGHTLWSNRMIQARGGPVPEGMADLCPACRRKEMLSRFCRSG
ncbi:MAG: 2Fe-2S iron-sulfur cluster-binding protein [Bacillota bacterium]